MTEETKDRIDWWLDTITIICILSFMIWLVGLGAQFLVDILNESIAANL